MRAVHWGPASGLAAEVAVLTALASTVGLGAPGWAAGLVTMAATVGLLVRALRRRRDGGLGPADWVTLARAMLVGVVAALVVDSLTRHTDGASRTSLVLVTVLALTLDAVDGRVARRTGTMSPLGARFDMEVDAFLILVLSVRVAADGGSGRVGAMGAACALAMGASRYLFVAAGWLLSWLRPPAPPRRWCKVVAAVEGIVLAVAVSQLAPPPMTYAAVLAALGLVTESFGRESWWLWRHRAVGRRRRPPRWARVAVTAGALGLVWAVLAAPHDVRGAQALDSVSWLPAEGVVLAVLLLVVPGRGRTIVAVASGLGLAMLALVKALDAGFLEALGRPFDPVADLSYAGSALGVLRDSLSGVATFAVAAAVVVLAAAVVVLMPLATVRLANEAGRHRPGSVRLVLVLGATWVLVASLGLRAGPTLPGMAPTVLASWGDAQLAKTHLAQARATLSERSAFDSALVHDPYSQVPPDLLLASLRGKDVLVVFVESYGRVALEGLPGSARVTDALDQGTARLSAAGFASRSAFLTSPTFGGTSWLAHSTLQSGLWVSSQERYDELVGRARLTLSSAFHQAGWRTVADVPANRRNWPEGSAFYGFDHVYDSRNVGYAGPGFGYGPIPDQYTLATLQRLELGRSGRAPLMAEVDLVSSHLPWAPLPRLVDWPSVGDGSVFDPMPSEGKQPDAVWRNAASVRDAYTQSIIYSMDTLVSFVEQSRDPNLVVLALGDHQPATVVSGTGPGRDVPVSLIARDPAVVQRIAGWGWEPGLRPGATAPVWRMDAFRDRFFAAYGPRTSPAALVKPR